MGHENRLRPWGAAAARNISTIAVITPISLKSAAVSPKSGERREPDAWMVPDQQVTDPLQACAEGVQ
jgi:hypothetical protein